MLCKLFCVGFVAVASAHAVHKPHSLVAAHQKDRAPGVVEHTKVAGQGYTKESPLYDKQQKTLGKAVPEWYGANATEPLSPTVKAILGLLVLYFLVNTVATIISEVNKWSGKASSPAQTLFSDLVSLVQSAPMMAILFLGVRMRSIQIAGLAADKDHADGDLARADPAHYALPQPYVQDWMGASTLGLYALILLSLIAPSTAGAKSPDGSPGAPGLAFRIVQFLRLSSTLFVYAGVGVVMYGLIDMSVPGVEVPLSAAVVCVMILTIAFFLVLIEYEILKAMGIISGESADDDAPVEEQYGRRSSGWGFYADILGSALHCLHLAPIFCILFIGTRMRAVSMGLEGPQDWAQACFWAVTIALLTSAVMSILGPLLFGARARKGVVEGDVTFDMTNKAGLIIFTFLRWTSLLVVYGCAVAIDVSIFLIKPTKGEKPPVSTAMACMLELMHVYFLVQVGLMICATIKQFNASADQQLLIQRGDASPSSTPRWINTGISMFDSARSSVSFAPMACVLFITARLRALQMTDNRGSPQVWCQDAMHIVTLAICIEVLFAFFDSFAFTAPESQSGGGAFRAVRNKTCGGIVDFFKAVGRIGALVGCCVIIYATVVITPQTAAHGGEIGMFDYLNVANALDKS